MHSEGFAAANDISSPSANEVVPLSEHSSILELLLQYMYRQPQPDMRKVDFHILAGVAEAAEKYQVYAATTVCNIHMRAAVQEHPFEVLVYAYKHNYTDIVDEAAPLTIDKPRMFLEFASTTAPCIILTWLKYQQCWMDALDSAHKCKEPSYPHRGCPGNKCSWEGFWERLCVLVSENLGGQPGSLTRLHSVFDVVPKSRVFFKSCNTCSEELVSWRGRVQQLVDNIPKFTTLM